MNCCHTSGDAAVPAAATPASWGRRALTLFQWAVPLTALALVPKCPMCVAAYVLLFTGVGLSVPAAAATRWTLIVLSIAALAYLLLRAARWALKHHHAAASAKRFSQVRQSLP